MTQRVSRRNPLGLFVPADPYVQTTVAESGRILFISGQCPVDENGDLVGTNIADFQGFTAIREGVPQRRLPLLPPRGRQRAGRARMEDRSGGRDVPAVPAPGES